jgi:hypothetical protein
MQSDLYLRNYLEDNNLRDYTGTDLGGEVLGRCLRDNSTSCGLTNAVLDGIDVLVRS